jgi:hypothetical protein
MIIGTARIKKKDGIQLIEYQYFLDHETIWSFFARQGINTMKIHELPINIHIPSSQKNFTVKQ